MFVMIKTLILLIVFLGQKNLSNINYKQDIKVMQTDETQKTVVKTHRDLKSLCYFGKY